ncbi:MAG: efflux transporter outer membrane subunit [Hydrogenophaga sp.]|uniref:efflux transporter outer membrane subunit n=1 Tax=Hydrogenophaga intermedia TaxID=65786 RepID=UPI0020436782|nr:efflux transporter outer membrane subunit [Hydrogenophaga intermedia]MCM3562325.1 efflux transporter outer membrane subunit [Hydrogenophaga intermedia]
MLKASLSTIALAVLLAGCAAVGPDHQTPAVALDERFINAGASGVNAQAPGEDIARFWRGFNDAKLDALIERALAANTDVRLAQARLQEARALQGEADAASRPGVGIDASAQRSVTPLSQQPNASRSERTGNTFDAGFIAAWEIDLFGGIRRSREAAAAQVSASEAGLHAAHTAVAAEVARYYLELRGLQERLRVTEASLVNQRESLRITEARFDAGRANQLDVAGARALVASTEAVLPALQTQLDVTAYRLATLTAQAPRAVLADLALPQPLPTLPVTDLATLPVGTPQQWLQRRPDVRAAERRLAAATAGIGIARSELYPRVSLSGLLGFNAPRLGDLFTSDAARYSLGVGLAWTPFDFGAIRSRIAASEARAQQGLVQFEQTVALALEETEGAFSGFNRNAQRAQSLDAAARHADEAAQLARARFDGGVTDFQAVLLAEREALGIREQLVQARVAQAGALVAVYRAIGGGWIPTDQSQAAR